MMNKVFATTINDIIILVHINILSLVNYSYGHSYWHLQIVYLKIDPPNSLEGYHFTPRYAIAYQNFTLGDEDEYIVRYNIKGYEIVSTKIFWFVLG